MVYVREQTTFEPEDEDDVLMLQFQRTYYSCFPVLHLKKDMDHDYTFCWTLATRSKDVVIEKLLLFRNINDKEQYVFYKRYIDKQSDETKEYAYLAKYIEEQWTPLIDQFKNYCTLHAILKELG